MSIHQIDELVSVERGEVDRRIFSDPEIFEREMEHVFGRAWLFLCHESQIKRPGDFFEAPMGRDNVLVVRQKDGSVKALLNTCMHRGNAVCRAEEGNTKNFMCTYHGWTYDIGGQLIGVPGLEKLYKNQLDRSELGLRQVAQLDIYKGFVFATMDAGAPPLNEFLGATGRLGLDLIAAQGDMEVVPGIQKFVIECNWKLAVDNLFDWYHPEITHMSAFQTGLFPLPPADDGADVEVDSGGATNPDGQGLEIVPVAGPEAITVLGEYGQAISGPSTRSAQQFPQAWRDRPEAAAQLGPLGLNVAGHANIFPTAWVAVSSQLSLRVPRSPTQTEIWWFTFADRNAPPQARAGVVGFANHAFGPAGLLEQDDGENWMQSNKQALGYASKKIPQLIKMNLGQGKIIKEGGYARIEGVTNEHGQIWTYAAWAEYVRGASWEEIKAATTPGDYL